MADVKWIKIVTDVFDNRKIKLIRKMPEGSELVVTWFQLLCLAGETNDNGLIYVTKTIPYTEETLATAFDTPLPIIRLALDTFTNLEMITIYDTFLCIANWEKYQNCDALEKIKDQTKKRVAKHRAKQKELSGGNVTVTLPVTHCNATEEDKEEELEEDKERDIESIGNSGKAAPPSNKLDYDFYRSSYNMICTNLPVCKLLTEKRKKAIRDFEKQLGKESFEEACKKANSSAFCTGDNDRGWKADFDFLIRPDKATSVLEGKYDGRQSGFSYDSSHEEGTSF